MNTSPIPFRLTTLAGVIEDWQPGSEAFDSPSTGLRVQVKIKLSPWGAEVIHYE